MSGIRVADRYVLDREIGRGASGAVWLARDEVLGRDVALKRVGIPPGAVSVDLARAEREARLAARVNHPNVIAVYDFVPDGDQHWLVTEYVDGSTLGELIRDRGRLSADQAAPLLVQAADALAAAHRHDIVHRDVKPSNILIARDGGVKLSDFGIARAMADASLTQTGLVTGSPAYLAPEVATGSAGTTASDVWSFGTTVFHALAGRPPYDVAGSDQAVLSTLYKIAHEPPPRLSDAGWLGPLLEATMDRDPSRRPAMKDVVAYLRGRPGVPSVSVTQPLPGAGTTATATAAMLPVPVPTAPPLPRAATPGGSLRIALVGVAAVVVLAFIGALLLTGGDDDPTAATDRTGGSGTTTAATDPADEQPLPPSPSELEAFATSYVMTAADDPDAGFALLTPDYQARSPEYGDFWGAVKNPKMIDVSADPVGMTVTYTYRYSQKKEGKRTETVTLHLVQAGDRLLIDDAVSSG